MTPSLHLWLIPILPLIGAAINGFFGRRLSRQTVSAVALTFCGAAFLMGLYVAARFPSLELGTEGGTQAGGCDSGYSCAYSSNISWRTASTPNAKEINPRNLFIRLFGDQYRRYRQHVGMLLPLPGRRFSERKDAR